MELSFGGTGHDCRGALTPAGCINNRCILDAILAFGKVFSLDMERMAVILLTARGLPRGAVIY